MNMFHGRVINVSPEGSESIKSGRVQVFCFGLHDKSYMTDETKQKHLPWLQVMIPTSMGLHDTVGLAATGLRVGCDVVGVFYDNYYQHGIVLGTIAGKNDNPIEAVDGGESLINKKQTLLSGLSPAPMFDTSSLVSEEIYDYPSSVLYRSARGDIVELSADSDKSRKSLYSASGAFEDILEDGTLTSFTPADKNTLVTSKKRDYVGSTHEIDIKERQTLSINGGTLQITAKGDSYTIVVDGGTVDITATTTTVNGDLKVIGNIDSTQTITGTVDVVGGTKSLKGHTHNGVHGLTSPPN